MHDARHAGPLTTADAATTRAPRVTMAEHGKGQASAWVRGCVRGWYEGGRATVIPTTATVTATATATVAGQRRSHVLRDSEAEGGVLGQRCPPSSGSEVSQRRQHDVVLRRPVLCLGVDETTHRLGPHALGETDPPIETGARSLQRDTARSSTTTTTTKGS